MRSALVMFALCAFTISVRAQGQAVGTICVPTPPECAVVGCPPSGAGMGQAAYMSTPPALRPQQPPIMIGGPPTTPYGTPFIGGPESPLRTPPTGVGTGPGGASQPGVIDSGTTATTPGAQRGLGPVGAPASNQPTGMLPSVPAGPAFVPPSPTVPGSVLPPSATTPPGSAPIGIPPATSPAITSPGFTTPGIMSPGTVSPGIRSPGSGSPGLR